MVVSGSTALPSSTKLTTTVRASVIHLSPYLTLTMSAGEGGRKDDYSTDTTLPPLRVVTVYVPVHAPPPPATAGPAHIHNLLISRRSGLQTRQPSTRTILSSRATM